eukprot:907929-Amphidinium_carterae.2
MSASHALCAAITATLTMSKASGLRHTAKLGGYSSGNQSATKLLGNEVRLAGPLGAVKHT